MKFLQIGIIPLITFYFFAGCAGSNCQQEFFGTWGGDHIGIIVSDSSATLEYDCAHGTIDEPLITDDNGEFEVTGIHVMEHGGPIRIDEVPIEYPALYKGKIEENLMTLTVTRSDTGEEIGTFTLTRGETPNIYKCQ